MNLFKNVSLRGKLYSGFAFVIFLAVLLSGVGLYSMVQSNSVSTEVKTLITKDLRQTFGVFRDYNEVSGWLLQVLSNPNETIVESGDASAEKLRNNINNLPNTKVLERQIMQTKASLSALSNAIVDGEFIRSLKAGKYEESHLNFANEVLAPATQASIDFTNLISAYIVYINQDISKLDLSSMVILTTVLIILGTLVSIAIAVALYLYISKSTLRIKSLTEDLEHGNFNLNVNLNKVHKDEIGDIFKSLLSSANTLNATVARTIAASHQLEKYSRDLKNASLAIRQGASVAEGRSITVAAAADEMVSTTSNIAKSCHNAQETSEQTRQNTYTGMDKVRATVARIKEQAVYTKDDAEKVLRLAEQSSKISSIVSTIDDIAAQTNLLALNAAIEAARAGEAGRGFAVVADEVRALASRTSQSTKEISAMVASVQSDSEAATESMNNSVVQMEEVAERASELESTLNTIVASVDDVNSQIIQIAHAAEQQTEATSEISSNMQEVTEMAQQSVDVASNAADVATFCYTLINKLLEELAFFTLDESKLDRDQLDFRRYDGNVNLISTGGERATLHGFEENKDSTNNTQA